MNVRSVERPRGAGGGSSATMLVMTATSSCSAGAGASLSAVAPDEAIAPIRWTRGDWTSTTTITTSGEERPGSAAEGTPRNRIVESRVWMMSTPITVPAMLNLPPMQRGAAEHDGEDRVQLDEAARPRWRRRP